MSSWLNLSSNISSITNNISSFTREVLTEAGNESYNDEANDSLDDDQNEHFSEREDNVASTNYEYPNLQDELKNLYDKLKLKNDHIVFLEEENEKIKLDYDKHTTNLKEHLIQNESEIDKYVLKIKSLEEKFESETQVLKEDLAKFNLVNSQQRQNDSWNEWNDSENSAEMSKLEMENDSLSNELMMKEIVLNSIEGKMKLISKRSIDVADFTSWIDDLLEKNRDTNKDSDLTSVVKEAMVNSGVEIVDATHLKDWLEQMQTSNSEFQNKLHTLENIIKNIESEISKFEHHKESFTIDNFQTWLHSIEDQTKSDASDTQFKELVKLIELEVREFDEEDEDFVIADFSTWIEKVATKIDDLSLDIINEQDVKEREVQKRILEREKLEELFNEKQNEIAMLKVELFNNHSTNDKLGETSSFNSDHFHEKEELEEKLTELSARCETLQSELKSCQDIKVDLYELQQKHCQVETEKSVIQEENLKLKEQLSVFENRNFQDEKWGKHELSEQSEQDRLQAHISQLEEQIACISAEKEQQSTRDVEAITNQLLHITDLNSELNTSREDNSELYSEMNLLKTDKQTLSDEIQRLNEQIKEFNWSTDHIQNKLEQENDLLRSNENNCLMMILDTLKQKSEDGQLAMSLTCCIKDLIDKYNVETNRNAEMEVTLKSYDENIFVQREFLHQLLTSFKDILCNLNEENKIESDDEFNQKKTDVDIDLIHIYTQKIKDGILEIKNNLSDNENKVKQFGIDNDCLKEQLRVFESADDANGLVKELLHQNTSNAATKMPEASETEYIEEINRLQEVINQMKASSERKDGKLKFGDIKRRLQELELSNENLLEENNSLKNSIHDQSHRPAVEMNQVAELSHMLDEKHKEAVFFQETCSQLNSTVVQLQNENHHIRQQYGQLQNMLQQMEAERSLSHQQSGMHNHNQDKLHNLSLMLTEKSEECLRLQKQCDLLNSQVVEMKNNTSDMTLIQEECKQLKAMLVGKNYESRVDETITMLQEENKQLKHLVTNNDTDYQNLQKLLLEKDNELSDMALLREECKQLKQMLIEGNEPQNQVLTELQESYDNLEVQFNAKEAQLIEMQNQTSDMELIQEECKQLKQMLIEGNEPQNQVLTELQESYNNLEVQFNSKETQLIEMQNQTSDMELIQEECKQLKKMLADVSMNAQSSSVHLQNENSVTKESFTVDQSCDENSFLIQVKQLEEFIKAKEDEISRKNEELQYKDSIILDLQHSTTDMELLHNECRALKQMVGEKEQTFMELQGDLDNVNLVMQQKNEDLKHLVQFKNETEIKLNSANEQVMLKVKQCDQLEESLAKQQIVEENFHILQSEYQKLEEKLITLQNDLKISSEGLSNSQLRCNQLQSLEEEYHVLKDTYNKKDEEVSMLKLQIDKSGLNENENFDMLNNEIKELKSLIQENKHTSKNIFASNDFVVLNSEVNEKSSLLNSMILTAVEDVKIIKQSYSSLLLIYEEKENHILQLQDREKHLTSDLENVSVQLNKKMHEFTEDVISCEKDVNTAAVSDTNNEIKELKKEVLAKENSLHNLMKEKEKVILELNQRSFSVNELSQENASLKNNYQSLINQNELLKSKSHEVEDRLAKVLDEKIFVESKLDDVNKLLIDQANQHCYKIKDLESQILEYKELEGVCESKNKEIIALSDSLNNVKKEKDDIVNNAAKNSTTLVQDECEKLRNEVAKQSQLYLSKMKDCDQLKMDLLQVEEKNFHMQSQLQNMKEVEKTVSRLILLENELEVKNNKISELTAFVEDLQAKIDIGKKDKLFVEELLQINENLKHNLNELQLQVQLLNTGLQEKDVMIRHKDVTSKEVESKSNRELERLRHHLMTIEDNHTQETIECQKREEILQQELNQAKDVLSRKSIILQDSSKQFQDHVENLQEQLHILTAQRDAQVLEISKYREKHNQNDSSMYNLQNALEQLQKDKDEQYQYLTSLGKRKQEELEVKLHEMAVEHQRVQSTMADASLAVQGIGKLRLELNQKDHELTISKEKIHELSTALQEHHIKWNQMVESSDTKLDKSLIRNLLHQYFLAGDDKRPAIVQIIGNLIGFSQDEIHEIGSGAVRSKVGGWMSNVWGYGTPSKTSTKSALKKTTKDVDQSFSELFVKFLEHETEKKSKIQSASLSIETSETASVKSNLLMAQSTPDILSFHNNKKENPKLDVRIPAPGQEIPKVHTHHAQTTLKSLLS